MTRGECLKAADMCINGKRQMDYGTPENNFKTIADLWGTYKGVKFTPTDVAMMMALLKIARICTGHGTEDCFVDLAGYAACGCEILTAAELDATPSPSPSENVSEGLKEAINRMEEKMEEYLDDRK